MPTAPSPSGPGPLEGTKPVSRRATSAAAGRQPIRTRPARPCSQSGEELGPPVAAAAFGNAHAQAGQSAVQDVRPVPGAVHPGIHDCGRVLLPASDVLRPGTDAGLLGPIERAQAIRVLMAEEPAVPHVLA